MRIAAGGALGGIAATVAIPLKASTSMPDKFADGLSTHSKVAVDQKGIQLVIAGSDGFSASPFSAGANIALVIDGRVLQFGFGRGAMQNLMMAGVDPLDIDEVYLTRLSFDFVAECNYYAATSLIAGRHKNLSVFGPPGTKALSDIAAESLQKASLKPLRRAQYGTGGSSASEGKLTCKVTELSAGILGHNNLYKITASRGGTGLGEVTSLVYRIDSDYGSIALSTGAGPSEAMERLARDVDILVHHFTMPKHGLVADLTLDTNGQHQSQEITYPADLGKLARKANVKMLLPYCSPLPASLATAADLSPSYAEVGEAITRNFGGSVVLSEDRSILLMS